MLFFTDIEAIHKKIKALATTGTCSIRFRDTVCMVIAQYLNTNMFTLRLLPEVTREQNYQKLAYLSVLREQIDNTRQLLNDAIVARRFDDTQILKSALDDLLKEEEEVSFNSN